MFQYHITGILFIEKDKVTYESQALFPLNAYMCKYVYAVLTSVSPCVYWLNKCECMKMPLC